MTLMNIVQKRAGPEECAPSMIAVGDIQFGPDFSGVPESDVTRLVRGGDIRIGTLETAVTDRNLESDKMIQVKMSPRVARFLKDFHFNLLTLANNHTCDFGTEGLLDTMDTMVELGIRYVGVGRTIREARHPVDFKIQGKRLSFISFSSVYGPGARATASKPGLSYLRVTSHWVINALLQFEQPGSLPAVVTHSVREDLDAIKTEVERAAKQSDLVIAMPHWGVAYRYEVADYERETAHELIDAGADYVVASHPHVFHAVERYKGGLIFYSLGNFLFQFEAEETKTRQRPALWKHWSRYALIAEIPLSEHNQGEVVIRPIVLDGRGIPSVAKGADAASILTDLERLSKVESTKVDVDLSEGIVRV